MVEMVDAVEGELALLLFRLFCHYKAKQNYILGRG
jgi:hypothetical protein